MNPEQLFNENFAAIQQLKQSGQAKTWEDAYKAVTGQSWPHGKDIKIDANGGHMVKDPGILGKIAKVGSIAAPITATILTGGAASPWLVGALGAGTGALSSAANGGGWKGALKGAAIGGATGAASSIGGKYISSLMNKGGQAAAQAATGEFVGPTLEQASADFVGPTLEQAGADTMNAALGHGSSSIIDKVVGGLKKGLSSPNSTNEENPQAQGWADLGSMMGSLGQAEATNRYLRGGLTQNYDKLNLAASEENRNRENDALKNLARTSYLTSGGAQPINRVVNSGVMPDFGFGPRPASAAQMQGASTLQNTLLQRLTPAGQIKPTDPNSYLKEGALENIGKWGGIAAGGIGAAKDIFHF